MTLPAFAGAPIGGVLFSLEEACSVWSRRIAWRCFLACAIAVLTHSTLNPHSANGLLSADLRPLHPQEWLQQLPAIMAVSAGGGLLGAGFNKLRLVMRPWRAKAKHHGGRVREVAIVAALTAATIATLAVTVGRCLPVPDEWAADPMWVRNTCAAGEYNDLATAWLAPAGGSMRRGPPPAEACGMHAVCNPAAASLQLLGKWACIPCMSFLQCGPSAPSFRWAPRLSPWQQRCAVPCCALLGWACLPSMVPDAVSYHLLS